MKDIALLYSYYKFLIKHDVFLIDHSKGVFRISLRFALCYIFQKPVELLHANWRAPKTVIFKFLVWFCGHLVIFLLVGFLLFICSLVDYVLIEVLILKFLLIWELLRLLFFFTEYNLPSWIIGIFLDQTLLYQIIYIKVNFAGS